MMVACKYRHANMSISFMFIPIVSAVNIHISVSDKMTGEENVEQN